MLAEPTLNDVLLAINAFASHVDEKFSHIDERFSSIDERFSSVDQQFSQIKATMVTKDYLDEKIADLRGDLVLLARKGNTKLSTLIEELVSQKLLSLKIARKILALEPFPQE